jgi:hypothetical protein
MLRRKREMFMVEKILYAVKSNKSVKVCDEVHRGQLLDAGYDIYDEKKALIEASAEKKVNYAEYKKLKEENDALKKSIAKYEKAQGEKV